jgi:16S rRNA (adenine1518-N6/adenine1519-N6)-dimethyltransferase
VFRKGCIVKLPEPQDAKLKRDPRALLKAYGLKPKKRLGQNFLVSKPALERVVRAADLSGGEDVLEIGAGLGALTLLLAEQAARVVTVEIDQELLPPLSWVLGGLQNVELRAGDILSMDLAELGLRRGYVVVANIPYQITSRLIRLLLEHEYSAVRLVLTIQKEVAERIIAEAGDKSLLALSVDVFGRGGIEAVIGADAFYPQPGVDSAVLRIDRHAQPLVDREHLSDFFNLARAGFGQKRKQLLNSLSSGLGLPKEPMQQALLAAGISPSQRAQELDLQDWARLLSAMIESSLL